MVASLALARRSLVQLMLPPYNRLLVADTQPQVAASRRGLRAGQRQR